MRCATVASGTRNARAISSVRRPPSSRRLSATCDGELPHLDREPVVAAEPVDGAVLGGEHEPAAGVGRHAGDRPLLQRRQHRVLGQLLGQPDVAHQPGQAGHDAGGFQPPDRLDPGRRVRRG
jgi:hypothetical protein